MAAPPLDPLVWKACAGGSVRIPTVGSTVYYFPQGHSEQASSPPNFSSIAVRQPCHRCRITSVIFLANRDTDEVYAKIVLDPTPPSGTPAPAAVPNPADVVAFPKVLTPSDANNGGGFSVPRHCAESIFPPLDYDAEPPYQNISIRDVHGTVWGFRHIFRGTPRRHLLTTGWSKFVNSKMLVAGDSVVFIRDQVGELVLGIRRAARTFGSGSVAVKSDVPPKEGFSRNVKGRVPAETVVEAVKMAEMGRPFEVIYYPRSGSPDFVVDAEVVEASSRVHWTVGLPVKMAVEAEDGSTTTCLQGMVSGTVVNDPVLWPRSPWRMLQVTLDEKVPKNIRTMNPWQVELASNAFHLPSPYPAFKRLKSLPSSEQDKNVEPNIYYPVTGFIGELPHSFFSYNHFSASMQGARPNSCELNLTNLVHKNTDYLFSESSKVIKGPENKNIAYLFPHSSKVNKGPEKFNNVSTELSIGVSVGSFSQSDSSSPRSQSNNTEFVGTVDNSVEIKHSLKLFGTIISVNQKGVQATV